RPDGVSPYRPARMDGPVLPIRVHLRASVAPSPTQRPSWGGLSQALQVRDQVIELLIGQFSRAAGDAVGVMRAGEGVAEGLGPAVVEVGVLVVDAAERGGIVAAVGVVGLLEAGDVDLAVGEVRTVVAGGARSLGRAKDVLPPLRGRGQA